MSPKFVIQDGIATSTDSVVQNLPSTRNTGLKWQWHPNEGKRNRRPECLAGGSSRAPTPTARTTASSTATRSPPPPLPAPRGPPRTAASPAAAAARVGLAPSKSTVYVSHLDFALTYSDLHTLFSRFGRVARVTVLKDRDSRRSRGVAFVLFVRREDAAAAAAEMHGKVLNGRTLSASIAEDNGRAAEFIRRRVYRDKSRCYECGEEGHLSYECPRNQLGPRERPPPSKKSRRGGGSGGGGGGGGGGRGASWQSDDEDSAAAFEDDRWASVVDTRGEEEKAAGKGEGKAMKKEKRKGYFSDESDEDED
ncbi:hypothetical protein OsI_32292 [Oryza sativa Indica Group]|nr:hypothetical protein OsI_32292 [Oryza sativa Indica Group]